MDKKTIDPTQLTRLAQLARLSLTPEKRDIYSAQLSTLLGYMQHLDTFVETHPPAAPEADPSASSVQPQAQAHLPPGHTSPLREDQPEPCFSRAQALHNAPRHQDGFFLAPHALPDPQARTNSPGAKQQ